MTKELKRQTDIPRQIKKLIITSFSEIVAMLSWVERASKRFAYEVSIVFKTDHQGSSLGLGC